ncbi:hypothetical protein BJ875DRAFT_510702 [Amylocarpus encephaloides]|uniref:Uncharacterized protein n=1 Tax=Amylocarpus encephaloides TaxID=45428 RepID=A0A9P8C4Z5_9HELO|nr:hypothetical protein BJ875DRAFT_510702 [Amylocarpus encephaloides]
MATSTSSCLAEKTSTLENHPPVPPSQATAAQVPLKDFNLPTFPPEAFSAGLTSLILTSDIKMDDQLFGGTTPESRQDATTFLDNLKGLKEVHFLDVFTPQTVMQGFAQAISEDVGFVEVSYTYRHSDPEFLKTLPKCELGGFVREGMKALRLAMQSPDVSERDEEDREGTEEGILTLPRGGDTGRLLERVREAGAALVLLDLTLFEIQVDDLLAILDSCRELKVLAVSISLDEGWDKLVEQLQGKLGGVESLEMVGVPGAKMVDGLKEGKADGCLNEKLCGLLGEGVRGVSVSILRTQGGSWGRGE